jgi:hypothetical protein
MELLTASPQTDDCRNEIVSLQRKGVEGFALCGLFF